MMMVHLPGVVLHLEGDRHLEEVLLLGEDLHQGVMVELGEEETLHQKALLQDADHHLGVDHQEMMVHPGEALHLGEILEKGMEEGHGGLVLLEKMEETLERGEVLPPGVCLQEEDLLPEETLAEMMTVEVVLLLAVHLQKVELGAAEVATGLLLGEVLHQGAVLLLEEGLHPGVEVPLPAEEVVTMAQLTGAVTALLPVMTLSQPNPDQPAKQKTQAGPLSSVSPRVTWDSPGFRDLLRLPGIVAS